MGKTALVVIALGLAACAHRDRPVAAQRPADTAVAANMRRQALNALDLGDGDLELRAMRQRLAANPQDMAARMRLAELYRQHGFPDVALEHYRLASAQFPDSAPVHVALAKMLREMEQPAAALEVLRAYQVRRPNRSWEVESLTGVIEDERGMLAEGEAAHRAALALDADRAALHNNLGYNLLLQGKKEAAAAEFRRALQIEPRSEIALNNLSAVELAKPAGPDEATAHSNLAALMIEQGRLAEARKELDAALALKRNHPAALHNLTLLADLDGRPAALPAPAPSPPRPLWRRVATSIGRAIAGTPEPKPAPGGAPLSTSPQGREN